MVGRRPPAPRHKARQVREGPAQWTGASVGSRAGCLRHRRIGRDARCTSSATNSQPNSHRSPHMAKKPTKLSLIVAAIYATFLAPAASALTNYSQVAGISPGALTLVEAAKLETGDVVRQAIIELYAGSSDI